MGSELIIFLVAGIISLILMSFSLGVVITLHFNKEGDNIFTEKRNRSTTPAYGESATMQVIRG